LNCRDRLITAINGDIPDRLPVTTHHLMTSFLENEMNGITVQEFFDFFGLDPIKWVFAEMPDRAKGDYQFPGQEKPGYLENMIIVSDRWKIEKEVISENPYMTERFSITTPRKKLFMKLQSDNYTTWVKEPLIKDKADIEIFNKYAPKPICDVDQVNMIANDFGERGILRGPVPGFDIYGQPGCWQDAVVLVGTERLIMETFDDPTWVHEMLAILMSRKKKFLISAGGAKYDLLELGGGSASTTVISPRIFEEFVAPYDKELIDLAHKKGHKVVYHTCGGMMPILEIITEMNPDAMETFTPPSLGGDVDLAEAKKRIGDKVCMIGGFDQFKYFSSCDPDDTRKAVRKCFKDAGNGGGYILSPSDHFFEADIECLKAFANEAHKCYYG